MEMTAALDSHRLRSTCPSAVLMAELVHHYFPKLVELHNYSAAHNSMQKAYNWSTLNQKVRRPQRVVAVRPASRRRTPAHPPTSSAAKAPRGAHS